MNTRTVTDTVYRANGEPWPGFEVEFTVSPGTFGESGQYPPASTTVTTDEAGAFSVDLIGGVTYAVAMRSAFLSTVSGEVYPSGSRFPITVPPGDDPITLAQMRAETATPTTPTLLGRIAALEEIASGIDGGGPGSAYGGTSVDGGSS